MVLTAMKPWDRPTQPMPHLLQHIGPHLHTTMQCIIRITVATKTHNTTVKIHRRIHSNIQCITIACHQPQWGLHMITVWMHKHRRHYKWINRIMVQCKVVPCIRDTNKWCHAMRLGLDTWCLRRRMLQWHRQLTTINHYPLIPYITMHNIP